MKLLFDQNLSPRLTELLADIFPESNHDYLLNLDESNDFEIWEFAKRNEFTIVTKDADFRRRLFGYVEEIVSHLK